jgi:rhodanese-related sulfurtransferase
MNLWHLTPDAARTLIELGYTDVWNLDGGMIAWQQAGLPLQTK